MGAVRYLAGSDLRRRFRRVAVLTLIVGLAGAAALATAAGARRTQTALRRFQRESRSADIELQIAPPAASQVAELERAHGVAAVAYLRAYGVLLPSAPDFFGVTAPTDDRFGTAVDRDRIIAGRAARAGAADEATVGEAFAARLHVR